MRITAYITFILLIAGLFLGFGVYTAMQQQQMLRTYKAVSATINQNDTRPSKLGGYEPDVQFTYTVSGKIYESSQAAPLRISGSRSWADSITRRIQSSESVAYCNPHDPAQAFLLPIGRFRPYGLILTGMALLAVSILPIRTGGIFARQPAASTGGQFDWFNLSPGNSYTNRALGWSAAAIMWYLLGIAVIGHYYLGTPPSHELKALITAIIYALAGLWPVTRALSAANTASRLGAPSVQMIQKNVHLNQPVIVRVELPFMRDTLVREVRVALICYRRNGLGAERYYASSQPVVENHAARAREIVRGEYTFEVTDKKRHPSTRFGRFDYPRTDWLIEVTTHTAHATVTVGFPILAETPKRDARAA
jgi:hypothetical protein